MLEVATANLLMSKQRLPCNVWVQKSSRNIQDWETTAENILKKEKTIRNQHELFREKSKKPNFLGKY